MNTVLKILEKDVRIEFVCDLSPLPLIVENSSMYSSLQKSFKRSRGDEARVDAAGKNDNCGGDGERLAAPMSEGDDADGDDDDGDEEKGCAPIRGIKVRATFTSSVLQASVLELRLLMVHAYKRKTSFAYKGKVMDL